MRVGSEGEAEGSWRQRGVGIIVGPGSLSSPLLLAPFRDNGQRAAGGAGAGRGGCVGRNVALVLARVKDLSERFLLFFIRPSARSLAHSAKGRTNE